MLWLAAYLTGFPPVGLHALRWTHGLAPMWSGLYIISTRLKLEREMELHLCVNALSGLYLISTEILAADPCTVMVCQCPLGLIPHFYNAREIIMSINVFVCQCPLGLIPHFYLP